MAKRMRNATSVRSPCPICGSLWIYDTGEGTDLPGGDYGAGPEACRVWNCRSVQSLVDGKWLEISEACRLTITTKRLCHLRDLAETVLRRLDLEAKEQGEDAVFICAAMRHDLRAAIAESRKYEPIMPRYRAMTAAEREAFRSYLHQGVAAE